MDISNTLGIPCLIPVEALIGLDEAPMPRNDRLIKGCQKITLCKGTSCSNCIFSQEHVINVDDSSLLDAFSLTTLVHPDTKDTVLYIPHIFEPNIDNIAPALALSLLSKGATLAEGGAYSTVEEIEEVQEAISWMTP